MGSRATAVTPNRRMQLLVWILGLAALAAVMFMADGGGAAAAAASHASPHVTATQVTGSPGSLHILADKVPVVPPGGGSGIPSVCTNTDSATSSYLPALRWNDFNLFLYDQAHVIHTDSILSSIASWMFLGGDLLWKVLFWLLNLGITFQPLCSQATVVNNVVGTLGMYAAFALIPGILFVAWKNRRNFMRGRFAKFFSPVLILTLLFGFIFYTTKTAQDLEGKSNNQILSTTGSVPWMGATVMDSLSSVYLSLNNLSKLPGMKDRANPMSAFYDTGKPNNDVLTCTAWDQALYDLYGQSAGNGAFTAQTDEMKQMSRLWEESFLSSFMRAQLGPGEAKGNEFPSKVLCKHLEGQIHHNEAQKAAIFNHAYSGVTAYKPGKAKDHHDSDFVKYGLIGYMDFVQEDPLPYDFAWAFCSYGGKSWHVSDMVKGAERDDDMLCTEDGDHTAPPMDGDGKSATYPTKVKSIPITARAQAREMVANTDTNVHMFDSADNDINKNLGYTDKTLKGIVPFAQAAVGDNSGTRVLEGLLSFAVSAIFLWSFGPMSVGLVVAAIALILLLCLFPIALLLLAFGHKGGMKMLKLMGAAAAATFMFGLALTFLTTVIDILTHVVLTLPGMSGHSLGKQAMLAAIPIAAFWLLKKILHQLGLGNIGSLSGSLGMMSAMAAKAANPQGKQDMQGKFSQIGSGMRGKRDAARRMANRVGKGRDGLQRLAQSRMLNNGFTQAIGKKMAAPGKYASAANARAKERVNQAVDAHKAGHASRLDNFLSGTHSAAKSRAGNYAAAAAVGGLSGLLGPAGVALLGAAATGKGLNAYLEHKGFKKVGEGRNAREGGPQGLAAELSSDTNKFLRKGDEAHRKLAARAASTLSPAELKTLSPDFDEKQLAGFSATKNAKQASKNVQAVRNNIGRIRDPEQRKMAMQEFTNQALDVTRAQQHGAMSDRGLNTSFAGFSSPVAKHQAINALADKMDVPASALVMGDHGLVVPAPVSRSGDNKAPEIPPGASLEYAANPALYLDKATVTRGKDESDDQYAARITATMAARGLIDDHGRTVDVFASRGVDIDTQEGADRVRDWLNGGTDEALSQIKYVPVQGEVRMVRQAESWAATHVVDTADAHFQAVRESASLFQSAENDLRNPDAIPVATLPAAAAAAGATAAHVARSDSRAQAPQPEAPRTVTMADTMQSVSSHMDSMQSEVTRVANLGDSATNEDLRKAAKSLSHLDGLERDVRHAAEGMRAASMARANVAIQHYATERHGDVSPIELRNAGDRAVRSAERDASEREKNLDRRLSQLFHDSKVARNASDDDECRKALADFAAHSKNLQEEIQSLYAEEKDAGKQLTEELDRVRETVQRQLRQDEANDMVRSGPNHRVRTSASILQDMGARRTEQMQAGADEESPV